MWKHNRYFFSEKLVLAATAALAILVGLFWSFKAAEWLEEKFL